jgi:DNA end-binding protein Ku
MPRAIWTGSISFGLVNVPVKLFPAVHQEDIAFHQLEESSGARIKYKRVSEKTGREVPWEKIVKGYELGKGRYVVVTPEELEEYQPRATKTVDIEDFVDLDDIDPVYYDSTYYLAPSGEGEGGTKAYRLLLEAMEKEQKVGIGRFVMRTKQYLAAIRPYDGVLALSTMLFEDEIVPRSEVKELTIRGGSVSDKEVRMATQIIESLTTEWKPSRYHDTYREAVLELIEKKAKGEEIVVDEDDAQPQKVVDLMAALEASLAAAKKPTKTATKKRAQAREKAAPRKTQKKTATRKRRAA